MATRRKVKMKNTFIAGLVALALQICLAIFTGFKVDEIPIIPGWTGGGIWLPNWIGVFIYPGASLLTLISSYIDYFFSRRRNVSRFDRFYPHFFFFNAACIASLQIYATLGGMKIVPMHFLHFMIIAGVFLIGLGNIMPRAPYRSILHLPIPWLYKSEKTWRESQRIMGFAWFMGGVFLIAGSLLALKLELNGKEVGVYVARWTFIAPMLFPIPYSYFIHKKTLRTK